MMLLSLIVETLDAELGRLNRLREIVAELGTPSANLVSSAGVAALLHRPESTVTRFSQSAPVFPGITMSTEIDAGSTEIGEVPVSPEIALLPEVTVHPVAARKRRARKIAFTGSKPAGMAESHKEDEVQQSAAETFEGSEGSRFKAEFEAGSEPAPSPAKSSSGRVAVVVVSPPKPSMVVVSAMEAARERASRAARQPAKRSHGGQHAAKPDAAPEDLARDLAARWLSGAGSPA